MKNNDLFSFENKLNFVKSLYITMLVGYLIIFFFLIFTNGSIQNNIQDNYLYILLPLFIPIFLSMVGLNNFKIEKNAENVKIYSDCIVMSSFSDKFNKKMIINLHEPFDKNITISHFGLRKSLVIRQNINDKLVKGKINISLLSSIQHNDLQEKLKSNK